MRRPRYTKNLLMATILMAGATVATTVAAELGRELYHYFVPPEFESKDSVDVEISGDGEVYVQALTLPARGFPARDR